MPLATSPYAPNDYKAASNYRPHELPINDIYKAITAQNKFWDDGAARVKNVYENALNLNLTSDENIQLRTDFMERAQKQLVKLSGMDLSDPSVQRQGFDIYKPLLKDKDVLYDDYITKKYKEVYNDADRWKNDEKTKGENFHMDNLAYALRPFKGFSSSTKRGQLEGIYKSAKDAAYTPYYDVSKERMTLLDKCKPDKYSNTSIQGMYQVTDASASLTSQKLWGCLEAGLSDKARQQIRISGAVRYGDDYNALKGDYIDTAKDKREYYNQQIKDLSTQVAAFKGKAGYEEYNKGLQSQIDQYTAGIAKLDKDINEYGTWDDDYMKKNYEDLATMAYFKRANGAFAEAFARRDVEQSKKADPVGMMFYTQKKLDERQAAGFTHDEEMKDLDLRNKLLAGEGNLDNAARMKLLGKMNIDPSLLQTAYGVAVEEEGTSYGVLKSSIETSNKAIQTKAQEIIAFAEKNPELAKVVGDITTIDGFRKALPNLQNFIQIRLKDNPNDVEALELKAGLSSYIQMINEKTHKLSILDDAQGTVEARQGTLKANFEKLRNNFTSKEIRNAIGIPYDPNLLFDILTGANPNYEVTGNPNLAGNLKIRDKRTGQHLSFDERDGGWGTGSSYDDVRKLYTEISNKANNFSGAVNTVLGERTAIQKMKLAAGNILGKGKISGKPEEMTPTMSFISSIFGSTLGGDVTFNTVGEFDGVDGWVDVQAVDSKNGVISASKLRDAAAASQYGASIYDESKHAEAIRIKVPYLAGIVKRPEYGETLGDLMNYASQRVVNENLPQGLLLDAGITPQGKQVQVKTIKSLATGIAKHTILVNGIETPIKIGNDASAAMSYVNRLITGQEDTPIK